MEQIDSSQIHLWLAFLDEIRDPRLLDEYRRLLSEEELEKQSRFHFERDQHRYLVTRAMVRMVLSNYVDIAPRAWTFRVNRYGRPSIAPEHTLAAGIEFNVSHTDGLVIMGVTRGRQIGVDVELVRGRDVDIEVAERYFAPIEVAALRAVPRDQQQLRFFEYWTLKESYIKARGMGLSIPLDRFAFHFTGAKRTRFTVDASLADHAGHWRFWQLQSGRGHLAAVCVKRGLGGPPWLAPLRSWP